MLAVIVAAAVGLMPTGAVAADTPGKVALRAYDPSLRGFFMTQPFTASGWQPIVNAPAGLKMTSNTPNNSIAVVSYDPDGNGVGKLHYMNHPWSASGWVPVSGNDVSKFAVTTEATGAPVIAAMNDPDGNGAGVIYAMSGSWSASAWQPFTGPDVSEVKLTAPVGGGPTGVVRGSDSANTGVGRLFFQHGSWTAHGWQPIADHIGKYDVTSPLWGGSIVAAISDPDRDGIGDLYYQGTPWTADGWKILANNVRDVSLGRDGDGQPRIALTTADGTVYAQGYTGQPFRYPFTAEGFMRIAANDMKLKNVKISGDVISGIRTGAGGNTIAVFQKDPLNETGWKDLANSTAGLELDDLAYKIQPAHNYWRYPTSMRYGGANRSVDTATELAVVWQLLHDEPDFDARTALRAGLRPEDAARLSAFYPTSHRYGGSLNSTAETNAVAAELAADEVSNAVWDGLTPTDQETMRALLESTNGGIELRNQVQGIKNALDGVGQLNAAEKRYCANPLRWKRCVTAYDKLGGEAMDSAARRFPASLHNGKGDAYRHCIWSGHMQIEWSTAQAKKFGDLHEDFDGNPPREKRMDYHNNWVGRVMGENVGSGTKEERKERIRDRCQAATGAGGDLWELSEVP